MRWHRQTNVIQNLLGEISLKSVEKMAELI